MPSSQGEDEVMFLEYRRQLKVLFDNMAQLVGSLCNPSSSASDVIASPGPLTPHLPPPPPPQGAEHGAPDLPGSALLHHGQPPV